MYKYVHINRSISRTTDTDPEKITGGDYYSIRVDDCFDVCTCVRVRVRVREKEREVTMFVHTVPEVDEHIEQFLLVEQTDRTKFQNNSIVKNRE